MLMKPMDVVHLVVDVQTKLMPFIDGKDDVAKRCLWLCGVMEALEVPVIVSEHCPDKIGGTMDEIKAATSKAKYVGKTNFSVAAGKCLDAHDLSYKNYILSGIEAHVCVLQTAIDLREMGKNVFVVADAVGSRNPLDKKFALKRMAQAGIEIVTSEMVAFELLEDAKNPKFKEVHSRFIK